MLRVANPRRSSNSRTRISPALLGVTAEAMKLAVRAFRVAYLAGRIPRKMYANVSSPVEGLVGR